MTTVARDVFTEETVWPVFKMFCAGGLQKLKRQRMRLSLRASRRNRTCSCLDSGSANPILVGHPTSRTVR